MYSQGWLLVGWLLVFLGLVARHGFAFLLGFIILLSAGASYLWDRYSLARVEYRSNGTRLIPSSKMLTGPRRASKQ